jgi:hypothetical protein
MMFAPRAVSGGVEFAVKAVPKSSRDRVAGVTADRLKVCVTAAPEKGRANAAVLETLAEFLEIPRSTLELVAGETGPLKTVRARGVSAADVVRRVAAL